MKITKQQLKQIIKEELKKVLSEEVTMHHALENVDSTMAAIYQLIRTNGPHIIPALKNHMAKAHLDFLSDPNVQDTMDRREAEEVGEEGYESELHKMSIPLHQTLDRRQS
tara:strand:- start:331 stop:660 length:330 start_codon:yes stop_codon:yes gene_type:complete